MIQIAKMFFSLSTVRGTLADLIFQAKEYQKNSSIYSRDHACLSIIICTTGSLFKLYTWSVNKTFFSVTDVCLFQMWSLYTTIYEIFQHINH
jgi:hypothetical protein